MTIAVLGVALNDFMAGERRERLGKPDFWPKRVETDFVEHSIAALCENKRTDSVLGTRRRP